MGEGKLILVLGGSRSGKSLFAEKMAMKLGDRVAYLATSVVDDPEMARRVKNHQQRRPANWITREEPIDVVNNLANLSTECNVILLDCLTLWLSNLLFANEDQDVFSEQQEVEVLGHVKQLAEVCQSLDAKVIVVSNEVGFGIVPDNRLGRFFRDVAGLANQELAKRADEVYLVAAGIPIELKSRASII